MAFSPLLAAGFMSLALSALGGVLLSSGQATLVAGFAQWGAEVARIGAGGGPGAWGAAAARMWSLLAPWLGLGLLVGLGACVLQVGLRWTPGALWPPSGGGLPADKPAAFDPPRVAAELAIAGLALLAGLGTLVVAGFDELPGLVGLLEREPLEALGLWGALSQRVLFTLGLWLCALAGLDWARRRQALLRSLRMTRSELQRELRELEADPQVRRRREQAHRAQGRGPAP